ncbi:hypothetical protein ABT127_05795 [Streptomyces sp. NPDC001904]|uniref:hypothetical protein n=1 Tax=Streptomyces sp. NPDC001904 TaxID=3154531 RepID=UPI003324B1AB
MSYNQPPPHAPFHGPVPPGPVMPGPGFQPPTGPKWAKKRFVIPSLVLALVIGVGIGASGGGNEKASADAKPAPTVTVTEAAGEKGGKAEPAPTVTVTKTAEPKTEAPAEKPAADKVPSGKVVFKVWGSAPSGVSTTYGSDSDNRNGAGLPMTKTLSVEDDALYFHVSAQLQGGGDINCSVTVDGHTKKGHASGGYNICMAQVNSDFSGGWN